MEGGAATVMMVMPLLSRRMLMLKRFYKSRNLYSIVALLSSVDFAKPRSRLLSEFLRAENLDDRGPVLAAEMRVESNDRISVQILGVRLVHSSTSSSWLGSPSSPKLKNPNAS